MAVQCSPQLIAELKAAPRRSPLMGEKFLAAESFPQANFWWRLQCLFSRFRMLRYKDGAQRVCLDFTPFFLCSHTCYFLPHTGG